MTILSLDDYQQKRDAHVHLHSDSLVAIQDSLGKAVIGRPWDRRIVDGGESNGLVWPKGRTPRDQSPSAWACEELAFQAVKSSSLFQERGFTVDAGETLLVARMLTHYVAQLVPTLYVPNQVRSAFPVNSSLPAGADKISYRRIERHVNREKRPQSLSPLANDVPKVALSAEEMLHVMATYALGTTWSIEDLERAIFAQVPLQREQLMALNEQAEQDFEIVGMLGDVEKGFRGAFNQAAVTITPVVTGSWGPASTHVQILGDLQALLYAIKAASGNGRIPDRLWMPSVLWRYLFVRAGGGDPTTVQEALQKEFPGLQIAEIARADTYDAVGTGPRIMAGTSDPMAGSVVEAMRFRLEAPQQRGFLWDLNGRQRLGGFQCVIPLLFGYMDGC